MNRRERLTDRLTVALGLLYIAAGVAETTRSVVTDSGGVLFWFGSLVGGGLLVLVGQALRSRPGLSCIVVLVGAVAGMVATFWTLVVPALAATVVILTIIRYGEAVDRAEAAGRG